MSFEMLDDEPAPEGAVIKVVGVGGAGGNAVNHMISRGVQGVEFIAMNTDKQALIKSGAAHIIQLGEAGLGAGANPEAGRDSARARELEIRAALEGANMVFLTAGMGKGTGTGASPVVASIAKDMGILTVGVVTKPFDFEGSRKMKVAEAGIDALVEHVDSLIVVLNQKLFEVMDEDASLQDAFKQADNVLHNAVAGIAEIINVPGLVNVDFADVRTVMAEQGKAMMGIGESAGMDRARIAAEQAVASPLLDGVDLNGARGVIVNITAAHNLKLRETNEVINTIREFCSEDATIIHGTVFDDNMGDSLRVTVVATGIGRSRVMPKPPVLVSAPLAIPRTGTYDAPLAPSPAASAGLIGQAASPSPAATPSMPSAFSSPSVPSPAFQAAMSTPPTQAATTAMATSAQSAPQSPNPYA
ncbi:MAG: cell division protein FtsZ, partial [Betaproteobacteria bacterium]|nr:cell division protein FtsZ [Betaproteobacteria bacterium]